MSPQAFAHLATVLLAAPYVENESDGWLSLRWFGGSFHGRPTLAAITGLSVHRVTQLVAEWNDHPDITASLVSDAQNRVTFTLNWRRDRDRRQQLPEPLAAAIAEHRHAAVVWTELVRAPGLKLTATAVAERLAISRNTAGRSLSALRTAGLIDGLNRPVGIVRHTDETRRTEAKTAHQRPRTPLQGDAHPTTTPRRRNGGETDCVDTTLPLYTVTSSFDEEPERDPDPILELDATRWAAHIAQHGEPEPDATALTRAHDTIQQAQATAQASQLIAGITFGAPSTPRNAPRPWSRQSQRNRTVLANVNPKILAAYQEAKDERP